MTNTTRTNAIIAAAYLARLESGMSPKDAFDDLFGAGAYEKLAGEVYEQLRSKQGLTPTPSSNT